MKVIANELIPVYETENGEHVVDGRELHHFLEVGKDFTSWMKDRLEKYDFEEGIDYSLTLTKIGERQNVTKHDYILKLDTAKEIAMVEGNEMGSKVRKYFIIVEKRFKQQAFDLSQLSPELQMFKQIWDGQAKAQIEQAETNRRLLETQEEVKEVRSAVSLIKDTIIQRDDDWRKSIGTMFNNAVLHSDNRDFQGTRNESYKVLEERAHCDLDKRLRNLVDRLKQNGATKTNVNKTSKIDVIEADPKLKEIYTSIIKELSVRHLKIGA